MKAFLTLAMLLCLLAISNQVLAVDIPLGPVGCRVVELMADDNFGYHDLSQSLCQITLFDGAYHTYPVGEDAHTEEYKVEWAGEQMVMVWDLGTVPITAAWAYVRESYPIFLPAVWLSR